MKSHSDAEIGRRLREGDPAARISDNDLDRVWTRLQVTTSGPVALSPLRRWLIPSGVAAVSVAAAAWLLSTSAPPRREEPNAAPIPSAEVNPMRTEPRTDSVDAVGPAAPGESPQRGPRFAGEQQNPSGISHTASSAEVPVVDPMRGPHRRVTAHEALPSGAESTLLKTALRQLRVEGRPEEALRTLADYRQTFPQGQLRQEAALARIDALTMLHRDDALLAELENMPLPEQSTRRPALFALKGHLLARAGRCSDAIRALDHALLLRLPAEAQAPALLTRSRCHGSLGDSLSQRIDLETLITQHPLTPEANTARAQLRALRPEVE